MIDLNNVVNTYDVTSINDNFDTVATELNDKVLYRDPPSGKANEMKVNMDMNGNRILNLPAPIGDNEPARKIDLIPSGLVQSLKATATQLFSGDGVQTAFALSNPPETEENTQIYVSGVYQQKNSYSLSGSILTFSEAPPAGTNNIEVVSLGSIALELAVPTQLTASTGSELIGFQQTGGTPRTVQSKLAERVTITDYANITTDGTDQTTKIITWLGTLPTGYTGLIYVPYGVVFNADQVYDALPLRAILVDDSAINSWNTAGSRARVTTLAAEKGDSTSIVDLTTVLASSGHNACTGLDNRGTAGSASGGKLVAAFQWMSGKLTKGQPGLRQLARWEWTKLDGTNSWIWVIRKFVPWAARNWEYWYPNTAYAAGATLLATSGATYSTTVGGVSGTVEPSHMSGTALDGTITWAFIQASNDQSLFVVNENGELSTNTTPSPGVVAYLKASGDSDGAAILISEATGVAKRAELRLKPTNGAGAVISAIPSLRGETDGSLRLRTSTLSDLLIATDTGGVQFGAYGHVEATAPNASTTPSVANCGLLLFANTGATSVTGLTNSTATQEVTLFFQNGNTTLVHDAGSFILKGGVNVTPAANTMIVMKKYSGSGAWFEKSRSF